MTNAGMPGTTGTTERTGPITGKYIEISNLPKHVLENPQVKSIFAACMGEAMQSAQSASGGTAPTSEEVERLKNRCVREKFAALPPTAAKAIADQIGSVNPEVQENLKYVSNPAYQALQDYLAKRLEEALYGMMGTQQKKMVEHKVFYNLYKTQLGKNIISTLSSYCINSDESGLISADPTRRQEQRASNIALLSQASTPGQGNQATGNAVTQPQGAPMSPNEGYMHFGSCIPRITHICARTKYNYKMADGQMGAIDYGTDAPFGGSDVRPTPTPGADLNADQGNSDIDYTRTQACVVSRELKALRKELLATNDIEKKLNELKSAQDYNRAINVNNYALYGQGQTQVQGGGPNNTEKSIDDLTSLTTNEFENKSKTGLKMREQAMIFQRECLQAPGPRCQGMLNNNQDYNSFLKLKDEYVARTEVMKGKIMSMSDPELKQFLKDEGRTDQEIMMIVQKSMSDPQAVQLKQRIADNYGRERAAIVKALSQKMNDSNLQMGHKGAAGPMGAMGAVTDPQQSAELRANIALKLQNAESEVRDTILFNNMVSGYLQVTDGKGRTSNNSQTAYRELNDSYFNPSNSALSPVAVAPANVPNAPPPVPTIDPKYFQQLQATTRQNLPQKADVKDAESTIIEVPTLNNNILGNYLDSDPNMEEQMNNQNRMKQQQERAQNAAQKAAQGPR